MSMIISPYRFAAGPGGDPYWSMVKLLCHFDGANGQTTTVDSSAAARTLTMANTASLTTGNLKFGSAGLDLSSADAAKRVVAADSADFNLGAGQFTIEAFVKFTELPSGGGAHGIATQFGGSSDMGWFFGMVFGSFALYYSTTGSDTLSVGTAWTPTVDTWYHLAVDRDASNVIRTYRDGVVHSSATVTATIFDSSRSLIIGNDENLDRSTRGYIDELRITKGVARYAGNFTVPSAAFPNF